MTRPSRGFFARLAALGVLGSATLALCFAPSIRAPFFGTPAGRPVAKSDDGDAETVEVTDYAAPKDDVIPLVDDRLADKPTTFDPALVDRRPVESWSLNSSAAVIRLDVPVVKPDQHPERLVLHPSYAATIRAARGPVLPSINMIDGKAKQFDDGLYAALDRAYYLGHGEAMKGHLGLLRRVHDKVAPASPAADYLAAGLSLGGEPVELSASARSLAEGFRSQEVLSKPIGFYTRDEALSDCFRVLRYFARPMADVAIPEEIARVLRDDEGLRRDYEKAYTFYAKLSNPLVGRTPIDFIAGTPPGPLGRVSLFPPSTSREFELLGRLFPNGLPPGADLMRELIAAIRSGKVDLRPREDGGWYDHQVYAMETLLLPEKGEEAAKLLLTRNYKKRMLAAFKALVTKRRETHARQLDGPVGAMGPPVDRMPPIRPRLRVEPNPTYFLRTARSYSFLADFLEATLGEATLKSLHGLREGGERAMDLHAELRSMRDLFYGLYLLSSEDIGHEPACLDVDGVDRDAAERVASAWLARCGDDPDLAADARVSIPIYFNPSTGAVRLWMTIGVRLAALDASYARAPSVRPVGGPADWRVVEAHDLRASESMIPVDEFAEVEIQGGRVLTRGELRAICDRMKTKEKVVEALKR